MNSLRQVAFAVAVLLLAGGYAVSQAAYFAGPVNAAKYAQSASSPALNALALVLLLVCAVSAFLPQREEGAD